MSDDDAGLPESRPKPSAARRARRIGGRPAPSPSAGEAETPKVELEKPRPAPAPSAPVSPDDPVSRDDAVSTPATGVRSLPLAWFPGAVLAVAAIVLLATIGVFSYRGYWAKPTAGSSAPATQQQEQVLAAAKTCFARLNSYDYRKLEDDYAAGLACTTGGFTTDYQDSFRTQVKPYATAVKIVRVAQVNKAGIVEINENGDQWVLLVYGQLQISNTTTGTGSPRIDPVGGIVTMDKVGEKWLVAKVDVDTGTGSSS